MAPKPKRGASAEPTAPTRTSRRLRSSQEPNDSPLRELSPPTRINKSISAPRATSAIARSRSTTPNENFKAANTSKVTKKPAGTTRAKTTKAKAPARAKAAKIDPIPEAENEDDAMQDVNEAEPEKEQQVVEKQTSPATTEQIPIVEVITQYPAIDLEKLVSPQVFPAPSPDSSPEPAKRGVDKISTADPSKDHLYIRKSPSSRLRFFCAQLGLSLASSERISRGIVFSSRACKLMLKMTEAEKSHFILAQTTRIVELENVFRTLQPPTPKLPKPVPYAKAPPATAPPTPGILDRVGTVVGSIRRYLPSLSAGHKSQPRISHHQARASPSPESPNSDTPSQESPTAMRRAATMPWSAFHSSLPTTQSVPSQEKGPAPPPDSWYMSTEKRAARRASGALARKRKEEQIALQKKQAGVDITYTEAHSGAFGLDFAKSGVPGKGDKKRVMVPVDDLEQIPRGVKYKNSVVLPGSFCPPDIVEGPDDEDMIEVDEDFYHSHKKVKVTADPFKDVSKFSPGPWKADRYGASFNPLPREALNKPDSIFGNSYQPAPAGNLFSVARKACDSDDYEPTAYGLAKSAYHQRCLDAEEQARVKANDLANTQALSESLAYGSQHGVWIGPKAAKKPGSFVVPESDSDTDDDSPPGSASKAEQEKAEQEKKALDRARSQAEKYKPKTPSGLRSTSQNISPPESITIEDIQNFVWPTEPKWPPCGPPDAVVRAELARIRAAPGWKAECDAMWAEAMGNWQIEKAALNAATSPSALIPA